MFYGQEARGTDFVRYADSSPWNFRTVLFYTKKQRDAWVCAADGYRRRRAVVGVVGRSDAWDDYELREARSTTCFRFISHDCDCRDCSQS